MKDLNELPKLILELTAAKGITLSQLSKDLGLAQGTTSKMVNGKSGISYNHMVELNQYFETTEFRPYRIDGNQFKEINYRGKPKPIPGNKYKAGDKVIYFKDKSQEYTIKAESYNSTLYQWEYRLLSHDGHSFLHVPEYHLKPLFSKTASQEIKEQNVGEFIKSLQKPGTIQPMSEPTEPKYTRLTPEQKLTRTINRAWDFAYLENMIRDNRKYIEKLESKIIELEETIDKLMENNTKPCPDPQPNYKQLSLFPEENEPRNEAEAILLRKTTPKNSNADKLAELLICLAQKL